MNINAIKIEVIKSIDLGDDLNVVTYIKLIDLLISNTY